MHSIMTLSWRNLPRFKVLTLFCLTCVKCCLPSEYTHKFLMFKWHINNLPPPSQHIYTQCYMSMFSNTHIFIMNTTVTFVDTAEEIVEVGHLIEPRKITLPTFSHDGVSVGDTVTWFDHTGVISSICKMNKTCEIFSSSKMTKSTRLTNLLQQL